MIETILFLPVALAVILLAVRSNALNIVTIVLYAAAFLTTVVALYFFPSKFTAYFRTDDLNILFLIVQAVVFFGVALYCADYLKKNAAPVKQKTLFTANLLAFVASMTGVLLSTHLALLWVFVEATTLSSSYLIYFSRSDDSLEATWKYLFICSIGIALAFVGIIFLSMGLSNSGSLFFDDLYAGAGSIMPFWLKIAFTFILAGFGTKVGFAPMHAWLPDAHSESPSPVSALLSGTLLNAALLGIIRIDRLMALAGMRHYADNLLLAAGFVSIFISAVYIVSIGNYKRMLAYSSIENMGIIAVGLGIGGAGLFAALLQVMAHSLAKAAFFLTSGNILHRYNTRRISGVTGLIRTDPSTGWLWILCFVAIAGIPPSPIFFSEFLIGRAMFEGGHIVTAVVFFLLLTVIMAGMGRAVLAMSFGPEPDEPEIQSRPKAGFLAFAPQIAFMAVLASMATGVPGCVSRLIERAASIL